MPITHAMVFAAGHGTRLRPLTDTMPKPLIPVAEIAMIDRILDWLAQNGITHVVMNCSYKAEMLRAHLATRTFPSIRFSPEPEPPLETGGGIVQALPMLGDAPFLSANGDTLCIDSTTPAIAALSDAFNPDTMDGLVLLIPRERGIGHDGVGDFFLEKDGRLRRRLRNPNAPYVFSGVQILHPRLFSGIAPGTFSLNVLYNQGMQADGTLPRFYGLVHDGNWLDIGNHAGLAAANDYFASRA